MNNKPDGFHPIITIIALCFNHEHYVLECLESIRRQSYQNFELIITDDCSSDKSVSVIEHWILDCGLQCKFIKHTVNHGLCKTLNEALALARGQYLAMIATDDLWLPDKLAVQFKELEQHPSSVGVLYSDAYQIDSNGFPLEGMFIESHRPSMSAPQGHIFDLIASRNFIPAMATLIRMECFQTVGHYDEKLSFEDWDMWLRIATKYEFRFSTYISAKYRILQTSMARTLLVSDNPLKLDTYFRIKVKCIGSGKLGVDNLEKFKTQIWDHAYQLYVMGVTGSVERMIRVYIITGRKRALLLGLGALVGLTHSKTQAIRRKIIG